jgi:smad nuclear-interacting protein 1
VRRSGPLPSQEDSFAITNGQEPEKPKEKPNFGTTGVLAAASNSVAQADGSSITLKYHEPAEARKPSPRDQWRLFIFKGGDIVDTIDLGARSCWLVGREVAVVDLPAEHPSISKQHAVIQFRYTEKRNEFGDKIGKVKPYLIDLESANGTVLNDEKVPDSRYLELRDKDMMQFGHSTREYVIMLAPRE